ncbi:MAG: hypothetical protein ABFC94_00750 [Syntrophomonas sp.]
MKFLFTSEINADLLNVDKLFEQSLLPWWDEISVYNNRMKDDFTWQVLPAVVLHVYKYFGLNCQIAIAMANIFKTIYFSNGIHILVKDDKEGQKPGKEMQFAILIGDFIFGRVLKLLVESDVSNLLATLSNMICEINEGMVLQYKLEADSNQVFKKAKAPLYSAVFNTAAQLSGLEGEKKEVYKELGYNLGMTLELSNQSEFQQEAILYMHKTESTLGRFKDYYNTPDSILTRVIKNLHASICGPESIAVVG